MGTYHFDDDLNKKKQLPAEQRGIGCGLMILLPLISYFSAKILLEIPSVRRPLQAYLPHFFGAPDISLFLYKIPSKPIADFAKIVYGWKNLEIELSLAFVILLVLSGVIGIVYAVTLRTINPQYGGKNAPPPKRRVKKKKSR